MISYSRIIITSVLCALFLSACETPPTETDPTIDPQVPSGKYVPCNNPNFAAIPGWCEDNQTEAWAPFMKSCIRLKSKPAWKNICAQAKNVNPKNLSEVRAFFEKNLIPKRVSPSASIPNGLMTGYYEPILIGSRKRNSVYKVPLHSAPSDLLTIDLSSVYPEIKGKQLRGMVVGNKVVPYMSRAELASSGKLNGYELVWLEHAIDAFLLQVQGSGRIKLNDTGETIRLAYADQNGRPFKSIATYLAKKGEMPINQASNDRIREWLAKNPHREQEVLNANPRYIFFKEEKISGAQEGPKGALGVPLTPMRSIAVDPAQIALGTPVFISTTYPSSSQKMQRLTMAQDTGSAIKGAGRIDFFWGSGQKAGRYAGRTKLPVTLWLLTPKQ